MIKKLLLVVVLFTCSAGIAFSQSTKQSPYSYRLGVNFFKGYILKHRAVVGHLIKGHPDGFELNWTKVTNGHKYWEKLYNHPLINYSFFYYDLKNPQQLGKLFIGSVSMDLPLMRHERSSLFFRIGTGLVYSTKPYNRETNNQNNMLSATFSYLIQARMTYQYEITPDWFANIALNMTHSSNGAEKMPNKGINMPTLVLGVSHNLIKRDPNVEPLDKPELDKSIHANAWLVGGVSSTIPLGRKPLPFFNVAVFGSKALNHKSTLTFGMEGFYNLALKEEIENNYYFDPSKGKPDFKRLGLFAGHELTAGKLAFIAEFGVYIYNPSHLRMPVYQRYGLKWHFNKHNFVTLTLKAHAGYAEQTEFGWGWKF